MNPKLYFVHVVKTQISHNCLLETLNKKHLMYTFLLVFSYLYNHKLSYTVSNKQMCEISNSNNLNIDLL